MNGMNEYITSNLPDARRHVAAQPENVAIFCGKALCVVAACGK